MYHTHAATATEVEAAEAHHETVTKTCVEPEGARVEEMCQPRQRVQGCSRFCDLFSSPKSIASGHHFPTGIKRRLARGKYEVATSHFRLDVKGNQVQYGRALYVNYHVSSPYQLPLHVVHTFRLFRFACWRPIRGAENLKAAIYAP